VDTGAERFSFRRNEESNEVKKVMEKGREERETGREEDGEANGGRG
jgi:hypothetical protein